MSDNPNTVLGYNKDQAEAVSFELQNTVLDLIYLSESQGDQVAVETIVTGLSMRIAILDGLLTSEEAEKLVLDSDGDPGIIIGELQNRAIAQFLGA